jgi:hypothetical protein
MEKKSIEYRKKQGYSETKPDKEGLWLMVCDEGGNIADYIAITKRGETLMTHGEDSCVCDLDSLHNGLIYVMWKFIA